jgi:probable HAF family extracellular repeat protein
MADDAPDSMFVTPNGVLRGSTAIREAFARLCEEFAKPSGVAGSQQVGDGSGPATGVYFNHALLWSGTVASVVDLNPSGLIARQPWASPAASRWGSALARRPAERITPSCGRARRPAWSDLHAFLPPGSMFSRAFGIDSSGNIVGFAIESSGVRHAFLWTPCEESDHERECEREKPVADPATFFLVGSGLVGLVGTAAFRKRRESTCSQTS